MCTSEKADKPKFAFWGFSEVRAGFIDNSLPRAILTARERSHTPSTFTKHTLAAKEIWSVLVTGGN
jgi:hypothetical protein